MKRIFALLFCLLLAVSASAQTAWTPKNDTVIHVVNPRDFKTRRIKMPRSVFLAWEARLDTITTLQHRNMQIRRQLDSLSLVSDSLRFRIDSLARTKPRY